MLGGSNLRFDRPDKIAILLVPVGGLQEERACPN